MAIIRKDTDPRNQWTALSILLGAVFIAILMWFVTRQQPAPPPPVPTPVPQPTQVPPEPVITSPPNGELPGSPTS